MVHQVYNKNNLQIIVNDYFTNVKSDVLNLSELERKEEDIRGSSLIQWKIMQYYDFMYLLSIIYIDIQRTKNLGYGWAYYYSKYNLEKYKKCVACDNIDYDKAIQAFKFSSLIADDGIEKMGVEVNFVIRPSDIIKSSTSTKYLIDNSNYCINYVEERIKEEQSSDFTAPCDDFNAIQDTGPENDDEIIDI